MEKTNVMVAGLPGKMAKLMAKAIVEQPDMELCGGGLAEYPSRWEFQFSGMTLNVLLNPPQDHEGMIYAIKPDIIVDFTQPKSVNQQAELYCRCGVPFVMGTTGGDRGMLAETIKNSDISAVIATNMAAPVVMLQAMIQFAGMNFRDSLKGWTMEIVESHQKTKPDPSGSAVGLLDYFGALGIPFVKDHIEMIRDETTQRQVLRIPEEYLGGHGFHTYTLRSPDGTVVLEFKHNRAWPQCLC